MNIMVPGIKIGHAHDEQALTGCTVILCEDGATCGIDKRGGGTTTRQADAFEPWHVVQQVNGILLSGGSAFGLGALSGVLQYLEDRKIGFDMRVVKVPIAAAAGLFDLGIGKADRRPDPEMAYQACQNASHRRPEEGCVGAGMGATVGKLLGLDFAMKSGIGFATLDLATTGLVVAALAAVNAGGDIVDPATGEIVAGVRSPDWSPTKPDTSYFADAFEVLKTFQNPVTAPIEDGNTIIGAILTNAKLNKIQATKVAQMAHDGLARTARPAHTMYDGDIIFSLCTGDILADVSVVGAIAAEVFSTAMLRGVRAATAMGDLPAAADVP
jgi:L-aminopeptidase/D-esterase-like protein